MTFNDMDLETMGPDYSGYFDRLKYGNGISIFRYEIGLFQGKQKPMNNRLEIETDEGMWFHFEADDSNFKPFSGFSLSWEIGKNYSTLLNSLRLCV